MRRELRLDGAAPRVRVRDAVAMTAVALPTLVLLAAITLAPIAGIAAAIHAAI